MKRTNLDGRNAHQNWFEIMYLQHLQFRTFSESKLVLLMLMRPTAFWPDCYVRPSLLDCRLTTSTNFAQQSSAALFLLFVKALLLFQYTYRMMAIFLYYGAFTYDTVNNYSDFIVTLQSKTLGFFLQRHKLENLKQMLTWGICFRI